MTSTLPPLTERTFDEEVLTSPVAVIVEFWAEWCPPCKAIAPVLDGIAGDHDDRLRVFAVNADEQPGLARRFEVMSIPTVLAFSDGELRQRLVGARSRTQLLEELDCVLS